MGTPRSMNTPGGSIVWSTNAIKTRLLREMAESRSETGNIQDELGISYHNRKQGNKVSKTTKL